MIFWIFFREGRPHILPGESHGQRSLAGIAYTVHRVAKSGTRLTRLSRHRQTSSSEFVLSIPMSHVEHFEFLLHIDCAITAYFWICSPTGTCRATLCYVSHTQLASFSVSRALRLLQWVNVWPHQPLYYIHFSRPVLPNGPSVEWLTFFRALTTTFSSL